MDWQEEVNEALETMMRAMRLLAAHTPAKGDGSVGAFCNGNGDLIEVSYKRTAKAGGSAN
jgi:hypothetical protein